MTKDQSQAPALTRQGQSGKVSLQTKTKFSYAWEQLDVHTLSSLFTDLSLSHLRIFPYAELCCFSIKAQI